jgi:hypothetical protein
MVVVDGLPADSSLNGIAADESPRHKCTLYDEVDCWLRSTN